MHFMERFVDSFASVNVKVSHRGQMSLPAAARRRWQIDTGGIVGAIDLGEVVVLVPGGVGKARQSLLDAIDESIWTDARQGFGDSDLANA